MRIGIIQSNYIPWRGYFDFIAQVDLFVIYDDVQFSKGSWRNRNQVKTRHGRKWLTVPVQYRLGMAIDEVRIGRTANQSWQDAHQQALSDALGTAPYFADALDLWKEGIAFGDATLSELNVRLTRLICGYLGITTPIVRSRDYGLTGAKSERLVQLIKRVGASIYLSGPSAKGYLDEALFAANGIALEYKSYDYAPYPQLWGEFEGAVTVLDLIANVGPSAKEWLQSRSQNVAAVRSAV